MNSSTRALDLGFSIAAPIFGAMLDAQMNSSMTTPSYGSALALVLGRGVGMAGLCLPAGVAARRVQMA